MNCVCVWKLAVKQTHENFVIITFCFSLDNIDVWIEASTWLLRLVERNLNIAFTNTISKILANHSSCSTTAQLSNNNETILAQLCIRNVDVYLILAKTFILTKNTVRVVDPKYLVDDLMYFLWILEETRWFVDRSVWSNRLLLDCHRSKVSHIFDYSSVPHKQLCGCFSFCGENKTEEIENRKY